jgi:hypothetical protein
MIPHPAKQTESDSAEVQPDIFCLYSYDLPAIRNSIDTIKDQLTADRESVEKRFDKLDDRIWVMITTTSATLLAVLLGFIFTNI